MQLHSHEVAKKESAVLTHRPVFHFVVLRQDLTMKFEPMPDFAICQPWFPGCSDYRCGPLCSFLFYVTSS